MTNRLALPQTRERIQHRVRTRSPLLQPTKSDERQFTTTKPRSSAESIVATRAMPVVMIATLPVDRIIRKLQNDARTRIRCQREIVPEVQLRAKRLSRRVISRLVLRWPNLLRLGQN